jgi:hypothetical protein
MPSAPGRPCPSSLRGPDVVASIRLRYGLTTVPIRPLGARAARRSYGRTRRFRGPNEKPPTRRERENAARFRLDSSCVLLRPSSFAPPPSPSPLLIAGRAWRQSCARAVRNPAGDQPDAGNAESRIALGVSDRRSRFSGVDDQFPNGTAVLGIAERVKGPAGARFCNGDDGKDAELFRGTERPASPGQLGPAEDRPTATSSPVSPRSRTRASRPRRPPCPSP